MLVCIRRSSPSGWRVGPLPGRWIHRLLAYLADAYRAACFDS
jgi:hypothetical protein